MIHLKSEEEIKIIGESGVILKKILNALSKKADVGINLLNLEETARKILKENDAQGAFLGYKPEGADRPYRAVLCTSLNDVVVHGVPFDYNLKSGDVLKIDTGVVFKGMFSDSAITVGIGKISGSAKKLISSTKRSLDDAIKICRVGKTLGDIGYVIEKRAKSDGFKVLRGLTGHGVGFGVHEDPVIFNFGKRGDGPVLKPGMVLAIEPMFSLGSNNIIQNEDESYSSSDRSLTAHFEHTVAITKKGPVILT